MTNKFSSYIDKKNIFILLIAMLSFLVITNFSSATSSSFTWVNFTIILNESLCLDITSPLQGESYITDKILVDISTNAKKLGGSVWFSDGSVNQSYISPVEINFPNGFNTLAVYANDSEGNLLTKSIDFSVNKQEEIKEKRHTRKKEVEKEEIVIMNTYQESEQISNETIRQLPISLNKPSEEIHNFLWFLNSGLFVIILLVLSIILLILIILLI